MHTWVRVLMPPCGPHPQDRRQALHQRTLAHQRSCGTPCGIRECVPAPVTDSEGGTVMPRAQDPYVNASRYLAAAITSFTPERHLLYPWVSRLCMNFARIPAKYTMSLLVEYDGGERISESTTFGLIGGCECPAAEAGQGGRRAALYWGMLGGGSPS